MSVRPHVILLIHGIRTRAHWQTWIRDLIRRECEVDAKAIGYGRYDLLRFLFPIWTRRRPIDRITGQLRGVLYEHRETGADVSVIAHSFGTYIVAEILARNPDISLKSLVFCGSVVGESYDWLRVRNQIHGAVVNDCGSKDIWPVIAKSISWGYGPTGTFGFKDNCVEDRVHPFKHSDYFDEKFVRDFWVPVFKSGLVKSADYAQARLKTPPLVSIVDVLPLKWLCTAAIAAAIFFNFVTPELQRYLDSRPALNAKNDVERRLTKRQLKDIQLNLCLVSDGDFGDNSSSTRRAIRDYQTSKRSSPTGELTAQQRSELEYPITECSASEVNHGNAFEKFSYPGRKDIESLHRLLASAVKFLFVSKGEDQPVGSIDLAIFSQLTSFTDQTRKVISALQARFAYPATGLLTPEFDEKVRQVAHAKPVPEDTSGKSGERLAWGRKVDQAFRTKVIQICNDLQCDPNHLMAVMAFETGRTFSSSVANKASQSVGLISFLPVTAKSLGTTTDELRNMDPVRQLDYVKRYLERYRGRISTLSDLYSAIFWPRAVGQSDDFVIASAPSAAYNAFRHFDRNNNGLVTKAEIAARVQVLLNQGLEEGNIG